MEDNYIHKYLEFEMNYWWFKARRDMILRIMGNYKKDSAILEVGCSGGPLLLKLKENGFKNITGIDISKESINQCKKRGLEKVYFMDGTKTSFDNNQFDVIIASDILEHIRNEDIALIEWKRILKRNAKLIVFVPAFNEFWSSHDTASKHYRRYTKKSLRSSLTRNKFKIEKISYWNLTSSIPAGVLRILQRNKRNISQKDQLIKFNYKINEIITKILKFENYLLTKGEFPFGLSVFSIAELI